jgi:hypothetical protein
MKIGVKKGIDVEAYYARCGPMVLRRCRRLLQDNIDLPKSVNQYSVIIIKGDQI